MFRDEFEARLQQARERVARKPRAPAKCRTNGSETLNGKVKRASRRAPEHRGDHRPPDDAGTEVTTASDDHEIKRLAKLPPLEYERERKQAAERLQTRAPILDRLVIAERQAAGADGKQGRALQFPEIDPWPDLIKGPDLLEAISAAIRRHVVLSDEAAHTAALWVVHTYMLSCFGISPRLAITSPEKGCGKTTLLDILDRLVLRPLPTANVTPAAVFRVVEMQAPTLLIDEGDTFLHENDELRGILNSGHRRGGTVLRTVGEDLQPRAFATYSACAIALIGSLPATLADRSVPIGLRRRRADERVESFRFDRTAHLDELARKAARWAADNIELIRDADPILPEGVVNRTADNWRPLVAIADAAGGHWPGLARRAVEQATGSWCAEQESGRVTLLADIRTIFGLRGVDRLQTAELVEALVAMEGRPWAEWKAGRPITATGLARLLTPFEIRPDTIRVGDRTPKGYQLARFEDAFARYLPPEQS